MHVRRNYTGAPKREKAPKSGKVRSVPLVDEVRVALNGLSQRDYLDRPEDLVFPSPSGGYLDDKAVRRAFVKALEAAELPNIRFHDLRHCFATLAVGVWELPRVQAYCGHAHISTTMRYVHHSPAVEDAAVLSAALASQVENPVSPQISNPNASGAAITAAAPSPTATAVAPTFDRPEARPAR